MATCPKHAEQFPLSRKRGIFMGHNSTVATETNDSQTKYSLWGKDGTAKSTKDNRLVVTT